MGGSGGSGSGKIGYPDYVEDIHHDWLTLSGVDVVDHSISELMNDAFGASPFAVAVPYDPDTDIAAYIAAVGSLNTLVTGFTTGIGSEATITGDVANMEAHLEALKDDRLTGNLIPRFEAGMRDINAVVSSAFVIGRTIIETDADQEVTRNTASHESKLRLHYLPTEVEAASMKSDVTRLMIEAYRIKIVAKKEENDDSIEYDVADAKWDLEVYTYGGNLLAAPGGGVSVPTGKKNTAASAIGGALSGAAAGAIVGTMGGPLAPLTVTAGAIIGGVLGLGMGLLS